jgi:sugar-specific transcriptional regulator TrmB
MYEAFLARLGLNENEAKMYELLLSRGETKARDLVEGSGLGRGNVYNVLTALVARGLVEMSPGTQQHYKAVEPSRLRSLVEWQKRQADAVEGELSALLPGMTSLYNLSTGRPVVEVFEGLEGLEQALNDTLQQSGEILVYYDATALEGRAADIEDAYVRQRAKKGNAVRVLVADTPEYRQILKDPGGSSTQVRYLKGFPDIFSAAVLLYGETVLSIAYRDQKIIAVILRDRSLYEFHHQLFEWQWRNGAV